jgi:hypothetical protein
MIRLIRAVGNFVLTGDGSIAAGCCELEDAADRRGGMFSDCGWGSAWVWLCDGLCDWLSG